MILDELEVFNFIITSDVARPFTLGNLMMKHPDGEETPAHLPNIGDMEGSLNVALLRQRLVRLVEDNPGNATLSSNFFHQIVDPQPTVRVDLPKYSLKFEEKMVKLGSFTDALMVFAVDDKMSSVHIVIEAGAETGDPYKRFHKVKVTTRYNVGEALLSLGEAVVIWNARGVARPSFKDNLKKLLDAYEPLVMVITESRVSNASLRSILEENEIDMDWQIYQTLSLQGGTVVLSEKKTATVEIW